MVHLCGIRIVYLFSSENKNCPRPEGAPEHPCPHSYASDCSDQTPVCFRQKHDTQQLTDFLITVAGCLLYSFYIRCMQSIAVHSCHIVCLSVRPSVCLYVSACRTVHVSLRIEHQSDIWRVRLNEVVTRLRSSRHDNRVPLVSCADFQLDNAQFYQFALDVFAFIRDVLFSHLLLCRALVISVIGHVMITGHSVAVANSCCRLLQRRTHDTVAVESLTLYINLYSPTIGSKEKENIHTYKYGEKQQKQKKTASSKILINVSTVN